jgi:hypothetical protein
MRLQAQTALIENGFVHIPGRGSAAPALCESRAPACSDLEVDPIRPQRAPGGDPAIGILMTVSMAGHRRAASEPAPGLVPSAADRRGE